MKKKGLFLLMTMFSITLLCMMPKGVSADTEYGNSDIERVYITSDSSVSQLTKDVYSTATIDIVDKEGNVTFEDASGSIKLRGNSTSKATKKPFKIKLSKKTEFLGMASGKKWNLLANAFDKSLIRNKLALDLASKIGLNYISDTRYADVYFNNQLLGSYLITEPVDVGANLVDIDDSGNDFMIELERERDESDVTYVYSPSGVRFAINAPEVPSDSQKTYINNYIKNVDNALKTGKSVNYSKYIDIDSFVNYYIISELFKAVDFNYSSTHFYVKNGKMYAGPLWDVDLSSGNASPEFYKSYYENGVSYKGLFCTDMKWFGYLIQSDKFVTKVNARLNTIYSQIENLYKTNSVGINRIDALINTYGQSFNRNYASTLNGGAGWSLTYRYSLCDNRLGLEYNNPATTYNGNVLLLKNWLSARLPYLKTEWSKTKKNEMSYFSTLKKSYNSVSLSWYVIGSADGYEISYKAANGKYKVIKEVTDENTFNYDVKGLTPGPKYTFRIRLYNKDGNEKFYSNYMYASKTLKVSKPSFKAKKKTKTSYKLTWKKVKGAKGYVIYMKTDKGKFKKVTTIKSAKKITYTKKKLKTNKKYKFKIKAYTVVEGKKYYSK